MSARRRRLILKPRARQDLRGALLYTRRQWRVEQRTEYKRLLYQAMRELVKYPDLGIVRDELCAGCRSRPTGRHVIYDQVDDEEIAVVRVLHARQDAAVEPRES